MGHEISQFDIPDRQLKTSSKQPRVSLRSDIGEAKITQTISGRAKVRVIREQDRKRRTWLLTILVLTLIAAAAWQGWVVFQQIQSEALSSSSSEKVRVSAPVTLPEYTAPIPPPGRKSSKSLIQKEIDSLVQPLPKRPPPVLKAAAKPEAKPDTKPVSADPLKANKPQAPPVATSNNTSLNQKDKQQAEKLPAQTQPAAPTVSTPAVTQPAVSQPITVTPPAVPIAKENTSTSSTTGDNQPSAPVKAQP